MNFVQTVGTNDCFSTEPAISICFFGGGEGGRLAGGAPCVEGGGFGVFGERGGEIFL